MRCDRCENSQWRGTGWLHPSLWELNIHRLFRHNPIWGSFQFQSVPIHGWLCFKWGFYRITNHYHIRHLQSDRCNTAVDWKCFLHNRRYSYDHCLWRVLKSRGRHMQLSVDVLSILGWLEPTTWGVFYFWRQLKDFWNLIYYRIITNFRCCSSRSTYWW